MPQSYVYILASRFQGTLYVGVTSNLQRRIWEHKYKVNECFTKKYNVNQLVYYEVFDGILSAIQREKQLKVWKRSWKVRLIEERNCLWKDLYDEIVS